MPPINSPQYCALQSEKSQHECTINDCEYTKRKLQERMNTLQYRKTQLSQLRDEAQHIRSKCNNRIREMDNLSVWTGEKKHQVLLAHEQGLSEDMRRCLVQLEDLMYTIDNKINSIRYQIEEQDQYIGKLRSWIANIDNQLHNSW